jgi:hypothetical protein
MLKKALVIASILLFICFLSGSPLSSWETNSIGGSMLTLITSFSLLSLTAFWLIYTGFKKSVSHKSIKTTPREKQDRQLLELLDNISSRLEALEDKIIVLERKTIKQALSVKPVSDEEFQGGPFITRSVNRKDMVFFLHDEGFSTLEIAKKSGLCVGEIELLLQLRRSSLYSKEYQNV